MTLLVSVVIPTYRRPRLLDRCLQALFAQEFDPSAFEIIIVDDGPEDTETRAIVYGWQQRLGGGYPFIEQPANGRSFAHHGSRELQTAAHAVPITGASKEMHLAQAFSAGQAAPVQAWRVRYPRLHYLAAYHTRGPAAARNLGWRFASAEIIAFTDDDTIPDPYWLTSGISLFQGDTAGVSGRVVVPLSPNPTDNARNTTGLESSHFVTANCFYRRRVLEKVGGFDERFRDAWREDSDLYFTLRERGYALAWSAESVVVHPVRAVPWGDSIVQQRKSFYNALLYKKHPDLYWKIIQPSPPWPYYQMLIFAVGAGLGAALSQPLLAATGVLGWAFLMVRFVARRLHGTSRSPGHVLEIILTSLIIPYLSIFWRLRGALHWRVLFL